MVLYLTTNHPTALEREMAETIRVRVERMISDDPAAVQAIADKLGIADIALTSMLGRHWSIATALRGADQLDFQELRTFAQALQNAA